MGDAEVSEADGAITFTRRWRSFGWGAALAVYAIGSLLLLVADDRDVMRAVFPVLTLVASTVMGVIAFSEAKGRVALLVPFRRTLVLRPAAAADHYRERPDGGTLTLDGATRPLSSITGVMLCRDTVSLHSSNGSTSQEPIASTIALVLGDELLPLPTRGTLDEKELLAVRIARLVGLPGATVHDRLRYRLQQGVEAPPHPRPDGWWAKRLARNTPLVPDSAPKAISSTPLLVNVVGVLLWLAFHLVPLYVQIAVRRGQVARGAWELAVILAGWFVGDAIGYRLCGVMQLRWEVGRLRHRYGLGAPAGGWAALGMEARTP